MINREVIEFKKKLEDQNKQGLVLDIDETLSWTIGYWVGQMQQKFGNPEKLSIRKMAAKYRYTQNVPYWQTAEALGWMENAKNDNQMQEQFRPIAGARLMVKKINKIIPIVGYLTTRPQSVLSGTQKWLDKYGYPKVEILARPNKIVSSKGDKWKSEVLNYLYPQVRGIVDDKLAVAECLPADYLGVVILFSHKRANIKQIKAYPAKTWAEVYTRVWSAWGRK